VGLWYFDPYARKGNVLEPGWTHRNQQKMDGEVLTIVSNNSNFIKGADNAPVLISWTDATTLFHEFGHAFMDCLQMLLIQLCRYCSCKGLCGISFSNFGALAWNSEVLNKFALHYKTNEPIPMALVSVSTKHLLLMRILNGRNNRKAHW
jgi:peptidyl-dipeptidase Dcp